jgi:hypothetical protein
MKTGPLIGDPPESGVIEARAVKALQLRRDDRKPALASS